VVYGGELAGGKWTQAGVLDSTHGLHQNEEHGAKSAPRVARTARVKRRRRGTRRGGAVRRLQLRRGRFGDSKHRKTNKRHQTLSHLLAKLLDSFSTTERWRWRGSKMVAELGLRVAAIGAWGY
jgi:hypothetical protein